MRGRLSPLEGSVSRSGSGRNRLPNSSRTCSIPAVSIALLILAGFPTLVVSAPPADCRDCGAGDVCVDGYCDPDHGCVTAPAWFEPEPSAVYSTAAVGRTNLIRNGDFSVRRGKNPESWRPVHDGFATSDGIPEVARVATIDKKAWVGGSQVVTVNQEVARPLLLVGRSRARTVTAHDAGCPWGTPTYGVYVDLEYDAARCDKGWLYGQTLEFGRGTHDWQRRTRMIWPECPVARAHVHVMMRCASGQAWFDDVGLSQVGDGAIQVLDGAAIAPAPAPPVEPSGCHELATADKSLALSLSFGGAIARLSAADQDVTAQKVTGRSGLAIRDQAAGSDFIRFDSSVARLGPLLVQHGRAPGLGLSVRAEWSAHQGHIRVRGKVTSDAKDNRAVTLYLSLPVDGAGRRFAGDALTQHAATGDDQLSVLEPVADPIPIGAVGAVSPWPLATVHNSAGGIGLGYSLDTPQIARLLYHPGLKQLIAAVDLGLSPAVRAGHFDLVLLGFKGAAGYRQALASWYRAQPLESRPRPPGGTWFAFDGLHEQTDPGDFGVAFHEILAPRNDHGWQVALAADDRIGAQTLHYVGEPNYAWIPLPASVDTSNATAALAGVRACADDSKCAYRSRSRAALASATLGGNGQPDIQPCTGQVWCPHGVRISVNSEAGIGARGWSSHLWTEAVAARHRRRGTRPDGAYLDSLTGVEQRCNYREGHFAHATGGLVWSQDHSHAPCALNLFSNLALARRVFSAVGSSGGMRMANVDFTRFGFASQLLDVAGQERDWFPGGRWRPDSDRTMLHRRMLMRTRPFVLLQNTHMRHVGYEDVSRYLRHCLFYGVFPSFFEDIGSGRSYWQGPYPDRDRHLFKTVIPLIKRLHQAGWSPLTGARAESHDLRLERFGDPKSQSGYYLTVMDTRREGAKRPFALTLTGSTSPIAASELLDGGRVNVSGARLSGRIRPGQVLLVHVTPRG